MLERPEWETVVLVCKACSKRGKGRKELSGKKLAGLVRRDAKGTRPRPRVLLTGCLGLCPKGATAIARVGGGRATDIVAIRSEAELGAAVPLLLDVASEGPR